MPRKAIKAVDSHVGEQVRKRRIEIGMSQSDLGKEIGVTFQQVQKYEKGTNRIGSSRLQQIANALQVAPAKFFDAAPTSVRFAATKNSQMQLQIVNDFVESSDGDKLMRAFVRLPREVRRSVVDLVEKIANTEI